jgi:hypothetical protein
VKKFTIYSIILVSLFCSLSYGQTIKEMVNNYLIEKQTIKKSEINKNEKMVSLNNVKIYKDYDIYNVMIQEYPFTRRHLVLVKGDNVYLMPIDYNKLLRDNGEKIDSGNAIRMAEKFVDLSIIDSTSIGRSETGDFNVTGSPYNVRLTTWTKVNGIRRQWNFQFKNGQFYQVRVQVVDILVGEFIRNEDIPTPAVGDVQYLSPKIVSATDGLFGNISIQNYLNEEITFSDNILDPVRLKEENVIARRNNNGTSDAERTITIQLTSYLPLSLVMVTITVENGLLPYVLTVQPVLVDLSGSATFSWIVPDDVHTGKCNAFATDLGLFFDSKSFFIYRSRTGNLPNEAAYSYRILYGDQFADFNEQNIENFANNLQTSIVNVYQEEIVDWGFPSPKDIDLDQSFDIYGLNVIDAYAAAVNNPLNFRYIGFGYPAVKYFMDNYKYTTELDFCQAALCHEFMHSIQYHWSNIFWNWGRNVNYQYITEGEARFIQTVYMNSHSSGSNEEFLPQRLYPMDANAYLNQDLNRSLRDVSYHYCIFWRYLFENYNTGGTKTKLNIIRNILAATNTVGSDPIIDGELAFDNALSQGGGDFQTFDDAIKGFAKRAYFNDHTYNLWNPPATDAFYSRPTITGDNDNDGITYTFDGSNGTPINDAIPNPFGIDYLVFGFDSKLEKTTINFDADPNSNKNMAEFSVKVFLMNGNSIESENEMTLTDGNGHYDVDINKRSNIKVVLAVTRLDVDQSSENDYKVYFGGVEVALLIDRSGSMAANYYASGVYYLQDAKYAANLFIDQMQVGDKIAITSFSTSASVNYPFTLISSDATKTPIRNAVNYLIASGSTAIGAGLQIAQGELSKGNTKQYQGLVLLSDGQENVSPMVANVLPSIPEKTDIYTVGLGSYSDQALLNNIAVQTGGFYLYVPDPGGLQTIYNSIRAKISKQQTIANLSGNISQGQTVSQSVQVDGSVNFVTFSVLWPGSDLYLSLIDPSGRTITPDTALIDPNIKFTTGATYKFYNVNNPIAGQWMMNITGTDVSSASEPYTVAVTGTASLRMDVNFDKAGYGVSDSILVTANLDENGIPVTGAVVTADIQVPTKASEEAMFKAIAKRDQEINYKPKDPDPEPVKVGSSVDGNPGQPESLFSTEALMSLFDDGAHNDGVAGDGIYANYFRETNIQGSYTFNVKATGTSPTSGSFSREDLKSTIVTLNQTITVTTPSTGSTWEIGATGMVNWSSTNITGNINIKLSTDRGVTYPIDLVLDSPNDGSEEIIIPDIHSSNCRIRVESASNNSIFGLNPGFFSIAEPFIPSIPTLVSPANDTIDQPELPTLVWNRSVSSVVVMYHYEVSQDDIFSNIVFSDSIENDTSKQIGPLDSHRKYYWRIKASNVTGASAWSDVWSFTTKNICETPATLRDDFNIPESDGTELLVAGRYNWSQMVNHPAGGVMVIEDSLIEPGSRLPLYDYGSVVWDSLMTGGSEVSLTIVRKSGYIISKSSLPQLSCDTANATLKLYARMDSKDWNTGKGYELRFTEGSPSDRLDIVRVGPAYWREAVLTSQILQINPGDVITFRVDCDNKTMTGLVNNEPVISFSDSIYLPEKWYFVIRTCKFPTTAQFDDFKISTPLPIALNPIQPLHRLLELIPQEYVLEQNYPNPFNPVTTFRFSVPVASQIKLEIYNTIGQKVISLVDRTLEAGYYEMSWLANVPSGVYYYRCEGRGISEPNKYFTQAKKMILLK